MWVREGDRIVPLLAEALEHDPPWHSRQKAALPLVYVQNASLEIAWTGMARRTGSIAGREVVPFFTQGDEGVDINNEQDWWYAEHLIAQGEARLPEVDRPAFAGPYDTAP